MTPLRGYPALTALLAQELTTITPRITRALEVLADARSPLKANNHQTGHNTTHPEPGQTPIAQQAQHDRHQLITAIKTIDTATRTLTHITNEWAPTPTKSSNNVWCDNHQKHGHHEPQATDGSQNCRWCTDVKRNYGQLPNKTLIDQHDRGRRISDVEYRRQLGKATT